jgi:hypothetical protein
MEKQITVHQALSELKMYDNRIDKLILGYTPISMKRQDDTKVDNMSLTEFEAKATSTWDQIQALINNKVAIKKAIVDSNAKTEVEIAGKKMTVADAITLKSLILKKKALVRHCNSKIAALKGSMNLKNEKAATEIEQTINGRGEKTATNSEEYKAIYASLERIKKYDIYDPAKIEERVQELEKEIEEFESNVDHVLSTSNAVTFIKVDV